MPTSRILSLIACSALAAGCATDSTGLSPDAVGDDTGIDQDDAKADGTGGLYNYFTLRPANDGTQSWWIERLNRDSTRCADGVTRPYCTVSAVRLADGLTDKVANDELRLLDYDRGSENIWGAYYGPDVVRGELSGDTLVFTEIWRAGRYSKPAGVWVQLSNVDATDSPCADASWATSCESRINSKVAWPVSIANLVDVPNAVQPSERERLLDPNSKTIIVGSRAYQDGLPIRNVTNIYYRRSSNAP